MWPFAFHFADLKYYRYHETRVAGFGPLFSGALLLSVGLAVWFIFQKGAARIPFLLVALFLCGSLLMNEHLWWTRYGPQFWLLALVPAGFIFWNGQSRSAVLGAWVLVGLLTINGIIVAAVRMTWETQATQTLHRQFAEFRSSRRPLEISFRWFGPSGAERFKNEGISCVEIDSKKLKDGTMLMSVVDGYPGAVTYRFAPNQPASQ